MDSYLKKTVIYEYKDFDLHFDLAHTLFSSHEIDKGTDSLLRHLQLENPKTILDLGCGQGPIGICLAKEFPEAKITMVDKDLLAVRYAKINVDKNEVRNVEIKGSVGIEAVEGQAFDVIISNVPAKIGDIAIEEEFLLKPIRHLNPGGSYWIVIVTALNRLIPKLCRKHNLSIKLVKKRTGHIVYKITNNK